MIDFNRRIAEKAAFWKQNNYHIEVSSDCRHIKFSCPGWCGNCYIDMMNDHTLCYGDYGDYIFERQYDLLAPFRFDYMRGKLACGRELEFDEEKLQEDLIRKENQMREYAKESGYTISDDFIHFFEATFQENYNGQKGDLGKVIAELNGDDFVGTEDDYEVLRAFSEDIYEEYGDEFGMIVSEELIIQFSIMELAIEHVMERELDKIEKAKGKR